MSLAQQLTVPRLRALAGAAFARGDAYWRQQRVVSCEASAGGLSGIVIGSEAYQVHVAAGPFGLVSECTCPVGAGMCKHAVALALHWLSEGGAPAPDVGPTFATRDELVAWAAEHDVVEALATCATRIVPELTANDGTRRDASYLLGRLALRDVGARDVAARYFGRAGVAIAAAARAVLEREAKDVRDGLAEERARVVPARRLAARLEATRAQLRAHAAPRSAAAARAARGGSSATRSSCAGRSRSASSSPARPCRSRPRSRAPAAASRRSPARATPTRPVHARARAGRRDARRARRIRRARARATSSSASCCGRVVARARRARARARRRPKPAAIEVWWQIERRARRADARAARASKATQARRH